MRKSVPGDALYRDRCGRCHDAVPPAAYSDAHWREVVDRMGSDAGLTEAEAARILAWLTASN
jgi:diheme cytochrome c